MSVEYPPEAPYSLSHTTPDHLTSAATWTSHAKADLYHLIHTCPESFTVLQNRCFGASEGLMALVLTSLDRRLAIMFGIDSETYLSASGPCEY